MASTSRKRKLSESVRDYKNEEMKIASSNHTAIAFRRLNDMRQNDQLCDMTLTAKKSNDQVKVAFSVHKLVLMAASPHFSRTLSHDMKEANENHIDMEMEADILLTLIEYMYGEDITIDLESAPFVMKEARYLEIEDLSKICEQFLIKKIHFSRSILLWEFASMHSFEELERVAWKTSCHYFTELLASNSSDLMSLSEEHFTKFFSDNLLFCDEKVVFEAICRWVTVNDDKGAMERLLPLVRMDRLPMSYLTSRVGQCPLVKDHPKCYPIYVKALEALAVANTTVPQQRNPFAKWPLNRRKWTSGPPMNAARRNHSVAAIGKLLFSVGGFGGNSHPLNTAEVFNAELGVWSDIPCMSCPRKNCSVSAARERLFVIGGNDDHYSRLIDIYDHNKNSWTAIRSIRGLEEGETRRNHAAAVVDEVIYTVGGSQVDTWAFDLRQSGLNFLPPLPTRRSNLSACAVNGEIWALGGQIDNNSLDTVEILDLRANKWRSGLKMCQDRTQFGLCALPGGLLFAGGLTLENNTIYNKMHFMHIGGGCWQSPEARMNAHRSRFGMALIDNVLYSVGGAASDNQPMRAVETLLVDGDALWV